MCLVGGGGGGGGREVLDEMSVSLVILLYL